MKIRKVMVWLLLCVPVIGLASELWSVGLGGWRPSVSAGDYPVPVAAFRSAAM